MVLVVPVRKCLFVSAVPEGDDPLTKMILVQLQKAEAPVKFPSRQTDSLSRPGGQGEIEGSEKVPHAWHLFFDCAGGQVQPVSQLF